MKQKTWLFTTIYIIAIVFANFIISIFGPSATIFVAFLLIGLDLVIRDVLNYEIKNHRFIKMLGIILISGLISYFFNQSAGQIAIASAISFVIAGIIDYIVFNMVKSKFIVKSNVSNLFSAATDSYLFPLLAFGSVMPVIFIGQFIAKVFGGLLWSIVLSNFNKSREV